MGAFFYPYRENVLLRNQKKQTDQKLIDQCIKGQAPAWEALIARYKRLVYHFPNNAGMNVEDCDEVFQETMVAVYRNLEKLKEVDDLGSWIGTVAQRTTWKAVNRRRKHTDQELSDETYDVADPDLIPEQHMGVKVQQAKVRQALSQLPDKCRKLLTLLFYKYDSSDYDEIAAEVGIARGSIGPTRTRCLAKFKEKLDALGINQKNVSKWLE